MKLQTILISVSLMLMSCVTDPEDVSNEIDVEWILVKTTSMDDYESIGYFFYFTISSGIISHNIVPFQYGGLTLDPGDEESYHILSFSYNDQIYNFDIFDSYNGYDNGPNNGIQIWPCDPPTTECGSYRINTDLYYPLQRITYNEEMNYFTLFEQNGTGTMLNSSSPNELIDYK